MDELLNNEDLRNDIIFSVALIVWVGIFFQGALEQKIFLQGFLGICLLIAGKKTLGKLLK